MAAIMHFTDDWAGVLEFFQKATLKGSSYEIATSTTRAEERFRLALQPVAERSGLSIRRPRTNYIALLGWTYMVLMVVFVIVLGILIWRGDLQ